MAFNPAGTTLATASWDGTVILWDLSDPAAPTRIGQPLTGHTDAVSSVAFTPAGTTLATASADRTVILWDLSDPAAPTRIGQPLTGHTGAVSRWRSTPPGPPWPPPARRTVILWDLSDPAAPTRIGQPLTGHTGGCTGGVQPRRHHPGHRQRGSHRHPVGPERPGRPHPVGQPLTGHTDAVSSVAFNPAGTTLATASYDAPSSCGT